MAEKHSIDTVKKALEVAKPRTFKESVEVAVDRPSLRLPMDRGFVRPVALSPQRD